jgi:hypothetical protein
MGFFQCRPLYGNRNDRKTFFSMKMIMTHFIKSKDPSAKSLIFTFSFLKKYEFDAAFLSQTHHTGVIQQKNL